MDVYSIAPKNNMSWQLKKSIESRDLLQTVGGWNAVMHNGNYCIKKAYKLLLGTFEKVQWRRLVCNNTASPKSKFMLWMVLQNRVATADRLSKWGIPCSVTCKMCNAADESVQHLFFQCGYSMTVWKEIHAKLRWQYQNIPFHEEVQKATRRAHSSSRQGKMYTKLLTETIYGIWLQRNNKIFNNNLVPPSVLVKEILFRTTCNCSKEERMLLLY
ncbi:uncharacterized protein LOC125495733 [Beta vulgaris subsp. vulgaris]|uniref:uncharacterized protein LOC125495733 n=1 Tax=Beta vulgaris subsp. vulgaris TaxID=3555 RepID=UPI00203723AC|nr:uncharacterized protein LOC125495733 [Beta vulgaris subsp. vulgaris]